MSLDFRLGFRMLVKYPALTIVGGLAIAFAIWAGATGYEAVTRFAFQTLPYDEPERIVTIRNWDAATSRAQNPTLHDFARWREAVTSVDDLGAYRWSTRNLISADGRVELVQIAEVSASAFGVARVPPRLGRPIVAEDERPGAPPVVVISHGVWLKSFDGDPEIIGRRVRLGNVFHTVVGVMPNKFGFLVGGPFWVPLRLNPLHYQAGQAPEIMLVGRLASGVTLAGAQAELSRLGARDASEFLTTKERLGPRVESYVKSRTDLTPMVIGTIHLFLILLIVLICGNVALLMFARAATREGEIAVRHALGASRRRIIGQLFAEALVLVSVAAAVGLVSADLGIRWKYGFLEALGAENVPFWERDGASPTTVLYAGLLAVLAAVIAGVVPALKATRGLEGRLRQAGAGGGGYRFGGFWTVVVVAQVAAMVALPPVAYYVRGEADDPDTGFAAEEFLSVRLEMDREMESGAPIDASRAAFISRFAAEYVKLEERLEAEPTVVGVTFADGLSIMRRRLRPIELQDAVTAASDSTMEQRHARSTAVAIDYFGLMNAPVILGRAFHPGDTEPEARTVIVNQSFVDRVLGRRNPIGQRVRYVEEAGAARSTPEPWYEIIGVVRDIGSVANNRERSGIYHPLPPGGAIPAQIAVHVREEPERFVPRLRSIAAGVDPTLRLHEPVPMDRIGSGDRYIKWVTFWLVTVVSAGAMLLSLAGIHAVLSFTITQRRREIGIRLALGGRARRVAVTVVRRPLAQVGLGVLLGGVVTAYINADNEQVLAIGVARILAYVVVMIGVCALAAILPTRRALQVAPGEAMKAE